MKGKVSKILLGILYLGTYNFEANASHSAHSKAAIGKIPAIQMLSPDKTADVLCQLDQNGTIGRDTIVVWDVDGTLIAEGSDQMLSGAIPIHPYFSAFIHATQESGTTHVALTNGGAQYDNQFNGSFVESVTPVSFLVYDSDIQKEEDRLIPTYIRESLQPTDMISYEILRIEGLKHIGISFENSFKNFEFFQSRQILGTLRDTLSNVPVCAPVFANGIISSNFVNSEMHSTYGFLKGFTLQLFINIYTKQTGRKFSNVVFVDDTFLCAESVFEAMAAIGMPCIGIHILLH
jgi:hypothetical protein